MTLLFSFKIKGMILGSEMFLNNFAAEQQFMCNIRSILLILSFFFLFLSAGAQSSASDTGHVEIVQDYKIKELVAKHVEINSKAKLKGYRIKIHFGADKTKASEIKAKFISKFPEIPAYGPVYDQPNFTIKVGDYRTKLEAYKYLKEVQAEFSAAFIVIDEIELPRID
ncbi:MAG: hypothetical protein K0Q95_3112 [Bacteroidota bacterium]|jgi:hypothetical protein|nr:hypothetical protein [Bacteroidota bacterium]